MEKSAFVAVVGRPNVGKSSLINGLVNKEILIVSKKAQTTRNKIAAIKTEGEEQFVFFDTPGLFKPRDALGSRMVKSISGAISDVDCAVLVVEPKTKIFLSEQSLIKKLKLSKVPTILVINKTDLIKNKASLIPVAKFYNNMMDFERIVFVSAKLKEGFSDLMEGIKKYEIQCHHFFPENMAIDKSEEFVVSEIFRQKLLLNLNEEVPHNLAVEVEHFKQTKFGLAISVIIYCSKSNHKGIVIGKNGLLLKKIATESRLAMERFFGCVVNLSCWVKVKPRWKNNEGFLNHLGF